ncbi:MAG: ABC transporter permease [Nitrospirae bacterium]|nr:ABC transporter permease [Nitrospirota bacterium]
MKFNLLTVAVKNLKRKPFRTIILIISIALFVSILVFGTSFFISVNSSLERTANRLGADVLVVPIGARQYADEALLETKIRVFYMDKGMIDRVKQIEGVDKVSHQTYLTTIYGLCCTIPPATVVIFNQDSDFVVDVWLKKSLGRKLRKGEVIIGHEAYENFGMFDVSRSTLFGVTFNIAGVLEKTGTGFDNAIFMSDENLDAVISKGKSGLKPNDISLIFVKVKEGYDPYTVSRKIEGEIIEVDTIERSEMGKKIIGTFKDINMVFLITIVFASLLSAFLAWTIFSAIVNERLREVGIMKALGAKGSHIVIMFILEVFVLGMLGSLTGVVLGTYVSFSLSKIFSFLKDINVTLTAAERIGVGMLGLLTGTGICITGALTSIMRMKNLEPFTAIKEA